MQARNKAHLFVLPYWTTLADGCDGVHRFEKREIGEERLSKGLVRRFMQSNSSGSGRQCDQIEQFIGLWATFKSLWQQLFCLNLPYS